MPTDPQSPVAKPADESPFNRRVFEVLLELAKKYKKQFFLVSLFAFLYTGADLIQPLIYRRAINDVAGLFIHRGGRVPDISELTADELQGTAPAPAPAKDAAAPADAHRHNRLPPRTGEQTLRTLLISATLLFLTSVVGYYFKIRSTLFGVWMSSRMESSLIVRTFGHVMHLPLSFFSLKASGAITKRIDQTDEVAPIVHAFAQEIAPEAVRFVGICAIMLRENWEMALVTVSMLPIYLIIARRSALKIKATFNPYYEMWENISAHIADAVGAVKTVKLSGAEDREQKRLEQESLEANAVYYNRVKTAQSYNLWQNVLSNLSKSMVLGYGGWLVLRNRLTPGDVVMFVAYLDRLYSPVDQLNGIAISLQQNMASLNRAVKLLDSGPLEVPGADLAKGSGQVEFRDVHFSYVEGREVLKGLNLTLAPGKTTVLAGPSGAGKTTTVDLLLKLYQPSSGNILIDGQPLSDTGPSAVRQAIGVVAADGAVFRGTLADNIRYKRPDATDEEMMQAALASGLGRALDRLPAGLQTEIGERGVGLSAGERQRLQIARILVDRPRLLVLDEATANLDYATEMEVKHALTLLDPRPTMLVIAHRYTMMKGADFVYVLKEGRVVEHGTPDELIAAGGWFAELAAQSGEDEEDAPAVEAATEKDQDLEEEYDVD